jgi:hypothetical protein
VAKKNALGSDPFEWLKGPEKKENTGNQKSDIGGQKKQAEKSPDPVIDKKETVVRQEVKYKEKQKVEQEVKHEEKQEVEKEAKAYEPANVSDTPEPQETKVYESVKVAEPYTPRQEETTFESSDISEENRKAVLGNDLYAHHTKPRGTKQKDSPATAFVIVYTVLLLILGFIIYKDLTRQISTLETKLEHVEKQLDEGLIDYEDTKPDGGW